MALLWNQSANRSLRASLQTVVQHRRQAPRCSPSMNIEDRCYPAVCLSVRKREEEGVFGVHLHAEFIVFQMRISVSSCAVCFSLKGALFDFTFRSRFRDLHVNLLCREDWWHQGNFLPVSAMNHIALYFFILSALLSSQISTWANSFLFCFHNNLHQVFYQVFCAVTCLWTLVSCSRLFSRKEIFCFWVIYPPLSSGSIPALCRHNSGEDFAQMLSRISEARRRWRCHLLFELEWWGPERKACEGCGECGAPEPSISTERQRVVGWGSHSTFIAFTL